MEEEASNVSNNKKPCGKIQANPTLFSLTHSLTHLCTQYKFSLSSLSHSKMMLMMKLMEWRKRWKPNPLHLTPSNPVPWSLSLGKLTDQERKEEHRKLEQRQKTRSKGTGQGDLRSCGMKSSILFWLSWQSDISVSPGPVSHLRGCFQPQVTSSLLKEAALPQGMLMNYFSCRRILRFPSDDS